MPFFIAKLVQPDAAAWEQHIAAHANFLKSLLGTGMLRAGGPLTSGPVHSGLLILSAARRDDVITALAGDPFTLQGVNESVSVEEWDPIFGILQNESSNAPATHDPSTK